MKDPDVNYDDIIALLPGDTPLSVVTGIARQCRNAQLAGRREMLDHALARLKALDAILTVDPEKPRPGELDKRTCDIAKEHIETIKRALRSW